MATEEPKPDPAAADAAAAAPADDAAPAPAEALAPIIVKKIQDGHGGAHGGAWKIALADMMTAMMAFFLLMWILGATNDSQRKSIADYFKPTSATQITMSKMAGSNSIMGGASRCFARRRRLAGSRPRNSSSRPLRCAASRGAWSRIDLSRMAVSAEIAALTLRASSWS